MGKRFSSVVLISFLSGFSGPLFSQGISLEEVIREVCTKSDSVKMMKESVIKSEQMVREKWSNALPVVSASATAAKSHGSLFAGSGGSSSGASSREDASASTAAVRELPSQQRAAIGPSLPDSTVFRWGMVNSMLGSLTQPQTSTIYSGGVNISQPIYTFGKVGNAIKIAEQFNESAHYTYKRNLQTLQLLALDAFYHALIAAKVGEIAEHSLARKKEVNEFLQRNFELGSGNKAQVLATRADVLSQSSATLDAKRDARTARMVLNADMGRPLTDTSAFDTVTVIDDLLGVGLPEQDDAVKTALQQRMDLKSLRLVAESYKGGAKIFKAMYLPSIGATGSFGYSKYATSSGLLNMDWTSNWTVGIGLQWTLFDGFANSSKAAQYLSDANKMEIACDGMSKMVEIEIRSDFAECAAADSNYKASMEMAGSAREGYDLTSSNFKQGSGQLSDLQRADEVLQQAELGVTTAHYRLVRSRAALLVAMGKVIVKIDEEEK
jgi:HAE1 family hydrophobic/amphiphilic exporter-1